MGSEKAILIVDDEPNLLRSLALVLRQAGFVVVTAASAAEALHCLGENTFPLVLLDLKTPNVKGLDLYDQIRQNWPAAAVLILTAAALTDFRLARLVAPTTAVVQKPIDPPVLLDRIGEILAQSPLYKAGQKPWGKERLLRCGPLLLDLGSRQVSLDDRYLSISNCAFNYLLALVRHAPWPVSYLDLTQEAMDCQLEPEQAVKQARRVIGELRQVLESDPQHPVLLRNIRGVGYFLAVGKEGPGLSLSRAANHSPAGRLALKSSPAITQDCLTNH